MNVIRDPTPATDLASIGVAASLALLVFGIWFVGWTPTYFWGDDWAGYLMQAQALVDRSVDQELALNTVAMHGSDVQIGPNAYPWGYPALLAIAGLTTDWSALGLKSVGAAAVVLLIVSAFALARTQLGLGLATFVALAVGLQPAVVVDADHLGSDVPFLAVSTLCLVFIVRQFDRAQSGQPWSAAIALAVALTGAAAFSIRSNGAVLPCTYAAVMFLAALRGERSWRETILHGAGFAALMVTLLAVYFRALPDGSLVHAGYLSGDPAVWAKRALAHLHAIANWVTFNRIPGPAKLVPLSVMVGLLAWGAARRPWLGAVLLSYLALHLALLTVFPFDGGQRYYHPLLPAAFLLVAIGCQGAGEALRRYIPAWPTGGVASATGALLLAGIAILLSLQIRIDQARYEDAGIEAPYAPATKSAMDFVSKTAPADTRIAFFRPRAFRLLTGRVAYAINTPRNLDRVDWYVFNGGTDDPRTQIPEPALRDPAARFRVIYDQAPYRIYAREKTSTAGEPSPDARGLP